MKKYDLVELVRDRDEELRLRQKTQRHLTQDDIRNLVESRRQQVATEADCERNQQHGDEG